MARLALQVLLAVCVLTAGCSLPLLGADHTREEQAVAALENATTAVESAETYRYRTDMRVVATSEDRTETVTVDLVGAVDAADRRRRANVTRDGERRRSYLLNRTAYRECSEQWGGWGVENLTDDDGAGGDGGGDWSRYSPAARQLSLLESGSLYWNGTTTVGGERAYLLTGRPTSQALTQYQDSRSRSLFGGPNVDDAEVQVWLDADTSRPLRLELHFDVSGQGGSAGANLTTRFTDYGAPVDVELPAEARIDQYELGCPGE